MHVSHLFRILRNNPKIDIFDSMKDVVKREQVKRLVVKLVLATDVSKHFINYGIFEKHLKNTLRNENNGINFKNIDDREMVMENLFHACDIGNPCLNYDNYMNWAALLSFEFNKQVELEEKENLIVTEMFRYQGKKNFYKGQIGFISINFII